MKLQIKILGHCYENRPHIAIFVSPRVMKAACAILMQDVIVVGEVTSKALKSYRGSRGIAPLILNVGTR